MQQKNIKPPQPNQKSVIDVLKRYGQFFSSGRHVKTTFNTPNFTRRSAQKKNSDQYKTNQNVNRNNRKTPSPTRNKNTADAQKKKQNVAKPEAKALVAPKLNPNSNKTQVEKVVEKEPVVIKSKEEKNLSSDDKTKPIKATIIDIPAKIESNTNKTVQSPAPEKPPPTKVNNLSETPKPVESNINKNAQSPSSDKPKSPQINPPPASTTKQIVKLPTPESINFQKVTQELATLIKSFQKQIQEVPLSKATMEQVPSAMIAPKNKEFFKNVKAQNTSNPQQSNQSCNKNQIVANQQNNLKSSSRGSMSSRSSSHSPRRPSSFITRHVTVGLDPLKALKEEVQRAIQARKTFTVRGNFLPIRKALQARGWVEKYHVTYKDHLSDELKRYQNYSISELLPLLRCEDLTQMCKNIIKSKLLGGYQVDFYWGMNDEAFRENPDKIKLTIINKLKRDIFSYTNKQGLCDASKFSYWYQKKNLSKLNHPRTYPLVKNGDVSGFIDDFRITAAMSLLKWVVHINVTKECKLLSPYGKIPIETFDFALNECCKFIKTARHEDIDVQIPAASENEWNQFLDYFYKLVHYNNHFKTEGKETEDSLVRKSNYILNNLKSFYPYVDMDGMMNIWILKPTASSRGRGIHMCRTLQYVLKVIKQNFNVRYIIQKYIERPLLIYNTKFDIRQWFLISNCSPLTIWMYKECYLRFSSQTYNLRKLHESIHLTNNSVQSKYKSNYVDTALPNCNMWDSNEFQKYLSNIGYPDAFKKIIYPGMKQCITAAVLMHQEKMVIRRNCFELYGADFMLTEDFQPWLIEINSNPALYGSTPVTAKMCPKVLEDVIKVIVDYSQNCKANTGLFEMIYREQLTRLPQISNLELKGLPLQSNYFFNSPEEIVSENTLKKFDKLADPAEPANSLKTFGEEMKKTLKNLLQIIHNEKQKRGLKEK